MEKISKRKKKWKYSSVIIINWYQFFSISILSLLLWSLFCCLNLSLSGYFFFWLEEELYGAIYGRSGAQLGAPVGPGTFSETFI